MSEKNGQLRERHAVKESHRRSIARPRDVCWMRPAGEALIEVRGTARIASVASGDTKVSKLIGSNEQRATFRAGPVGTSRVPNKVAEEVRMFS